MPGIKCKKVFLKLMEYLYCDKFVDDITGFEARAVSEIAMTLGLKNISTTIRKKAELAKMKIH